MWQIWAVAKMVSEYQRQAELVSWERGVCVISTLRMRQEIAHPTAGLRLVGYVVDLACSCGGSQAAVWAEGASARSTVRTLDAVALTVLSGSTLIELRSDGAERESSTLWSNLTEGAGVGCWFSETCRLGSGSNCSTDGIMLTTPPGTVGMLVLMVCVASALGALVCAMLIVCMRLVLRRRTGDVARSRYMQDPAKVAPYIAPDPWCSQAALM